MFDLVVNIVSAINLHRDCPPSLLQALAASHPDHEVWLQSYYQEKNGIESLGTFKRLTLGEYQALCKKGSPKAIPTMCILTIKKDDHLMPLREKSWIVVLGNREYCECSKSNLFAPVLRFDSLRYLVSWVIQHCRGLKQSNYKMPSARAFFPRRKSRLSGPLWVTQMLQRTNIVYFRKLFTNCAVAPVIGMRRLTQCCVLFVLCGMHMTLAYTPDLCGTLGILLHPIRLFLYLWVFTLTTLSISRRILMLRCCSNIFYWNR